MNGPRRKTERMVFDFETNAWVLPDAFNVRAQGHEIVLAAPDTEPAPGRWNRPALSRPAPSPLVALTVWLGIALMIAAMAARSFLPTVPGTMFLLFAFIFRTLQLGQAGNATAEDLRLLEDPDDPDICLVAIIIWRRGDGAGQDRGVAWFEGGRLLYSGHRTSFALGGEDVLPDWSHGEHTLVLRVPPHGSATVTLRPLPRGSVASGKQEMRFLKSLHAFRRRPPPSRGPRQWPPFEP